MISHGVAQALGLVAAIVLVDLVLHELGLDLGVGQLPGQCG